MQLKYFVPFKAQGNQDMASALQNKLLNIEGTAIDTSVNANKWQVPEEDLDYLLETLRGAQLRADHAESVFMVVGKVPEAGRQGQEVYFKGEVGDEKLIEKILRGYVDHVSIQVDSDEVECSKCKKPTRNEGVMIHLCPGAWEIVHKPRVRELSIVASPAYKNTTFKPTGFSSAMNEQQSALLENFSRLSEDNKDVGSKGNLQEPENKPKKEEVKPLAAQNAQQQASPHQAQGVVNVAPGEQAPKQVTYEDFMQQLTQLEKQIKQGGSTASDAELDALTKKISELESELAKRGRKADLAKKISELTKKLNSEQAEPVQEGEGKDDTNIPPKAGEAQRASGRGIVAVDEINKDALGNFDWFKDMLKAHKRLVGFS